MMMYMYKLSPFVFDAPLIRMHINHIYIYIIDSCSYLTRWKITTETYLYFLFVVENFQKLSRNQLIETVFDVLDRYPKNAHIQRNGIHLIYQMVQSMGNVTREIVVLGYRYIHLHIYIMGILHRRISSGLFKSGHLSYRCCPCLASIMHSI
jgi:hypothetical protein